MDAPKTKTTSTSPATTESSEFTHKAWLSESAISALGIPPSKIAQYRTMHFGSFYSLEHLVNLLKGDPNPEISKSHLTWKTTFLALSFDEAIAIRKTHLAITDASSRARREKTDWYGISKPSDFPNSVVDSNIHISEENHTILCNLAKKIAQTFSSMTTSGKDQGVFVKLSTRSPKDSNQFASNDPKLLDALRQEISNTIKIHSSFTEIETDRENITNRPWPPISETIESLQSIVDGSGSEIDPNDPWINAAIVAWYKVIASQMKCSSAWDVLQTLLNSSRVYFDLSAHTEFGKSFFKMNICFREWDDSVPSRLSSEFRCFCYKGNLTAASFLLFPQTLVLPKKTLKQELSTIWQKLKPILVPYYESMVFDLIRMEENKWLIIETNPFKTATDAGLFSWKEDRHILMKQPSHQLNDDDDLDSDFELRITTSLSESPLDSLPSVAWNSVLLNILKELYPSPSKCAVH